jgi:DNA-directed RNA polymerase subunit L
VETTGALQPKEIILASIDELTKRLQEFKEIISNLKK